jgi:hypothetical protein
MVDTVGGFDGQTQKQETGANQVIGFLQQHEELEIIIPVLCGFFVVSQFQLRGVNAILANLAVASLFRQLFRQLRNSSMIAAGVVQEAQQPATSSLFGEGVTIVHSVLGRVRLRIEELSSDAAFAKRLTRLLDNDDCVISFRINRAAASVVITYDSTGLSDLDLGLRLASILNTVRSEDAHPGG